MKQGILFSLVMFWFLGAFAAEPIKPVQIPEDKLDAFYFCVANLYRHSAERLKDRHGNVDVGEGKKLVVEARKKCLKEFGLIN